MAKPSPDARPMFAQYICKAHINNKYNINYIFIRFGFGQFQSVVSVFQFFAHQCGYYLVFLLTLTQLTQVNKTKQTERKNKKKKGVSPFLALSMREKKKSFY